MYSTDAELCSPAFDKENITSLAFPTDLNANESSDAVKLNGEQTHQNQLHILDSKNLNQDHKLQTYTTFQSIGNTGAIPKIKAHSPKRKDQSNGLPERPMSLSLKNMSNSQLNDNSPQLSVDSLLSQLHIDIESGDESAHSWRPNSADDDLNNGFLCVPDLNPSSRFGNESPRFNAVLQTVEEVDSPPNSNSFVNEDPPVTSPTKILVTPPPTEGQMQNIDLQNHLYCQKIQLNTLRYELTKSQSELLKWSNEIRMLEVELSERLHFPNAHDIQKLNDENFDLRNECQCLCIEVDTYGKGKTPLGEVNEDFYKKPELLPVPKSENANQVNPSPAAQSELSVIGNSEENEDLNAWECCTCTFANHPDINTCEICQSPRQVSNKERSVPPSESSCYCHSNKESVSMFS